MRKLIFAVSVFLLLLNGTGALYGGYSLISDPTGSKLRMPLSFLENSPFSSYLIPGIVLLIVNGIFSFLALAALVLRHGKAPLLVIIQGVLLSGWIIMQVIFLKMFYAPLHLTFLAVGICLTACGFLLLKHPGKA